MYNVDLLYRLVGQRVYVKKNDGTRFAGLVVKYDWQPNYMITLDGDRTVNDENISSISALTELSLDETHEWCDLEKYRNHRIRAVFRDGHSVIGDVFDVDDSEKTIKVLDSRTESKSIVSMSDVVFLYPLSSLNQLVDWMKLGENIQVEFNGYMYYITRPRNNWIIERSPYYGIRFEADDVESILRHKFHGRSIWDSFFLVSIMELVEPRIEYFIRSGESEYPENKLCESVYAVVKGSKPRITSRSRSHGYDALEVDRTISLDDVPFVEAHTDYDTDTMDWTLRRVTNLDRKALEDILIPYRKVTENKDSTFGEIIKTLEPLLLMMEPSVYQISNRWLIPTNGENELFQNESDYADITASVQPNEDGNFMDVWPQYLIPTQNSSSINTETVEKYRRREYKGRILEMFPYGFMTHVIDGHHKAKAAFLDGEVIEGIGIEDYRWLLEEHPKDRVNVSLEQLVKHTDTRKIRFMNYPTAKEILYASDYWGDYVDDGRNIEKIRNIAVKSISDIRRTSVEKAVLAIFLWGTVEEYVSLKDMIAQCTRVVIDRYYELMANLLYDIDARSAMSEYILNEDEEQRNSKLGIYVMNEYSASIKK
ncbi:hypothetical protein EQG49_04505 [Periweissella cryptocerci]|uniref:Uncharacterized protein n=1 Tax=Periweissella cryptocerci TaxID=2506420 RepID=A0A4P6YSX8_9LACO|nr:hypothetical protein [Periweissella cryptocerci]QBO35776.1 hypothetical protein EQG49_04505 [Periweissella cryptocerci]